MGKYGFVYIWYDRKHKRYYIGAHWGTEDDGYICSSPWMKKAYNNRPTDFKRRIIKRIYSSKKATFVEEQRYLDMIKQEELRSQQNKYCRYYNLRTKNSNHWHLSEEGTKSVREKISNTLKEKYKDPEFYARYRESVEKRDKSYLTPEFIKRRGELIKQSRLISSPPELRYLKPGYGMKYSTRAEKGSELEKQRRRESRKRYLESRTEEQIQELGRKVSQGQLGKPKTGKAAKGHRKSEEHKSKIANSNRITKQQHPENTCAGTTWWTDGINNKRTTNSPGVEWYQGKTNKVKSYNKQSTKVVWEKRKAGLLPMPNYTKDRA